MRLFLRFNEIKYLLKRMDEENLTVEQVAQILRVSRQTVWVRCKQGNLPAFKLPGSRRWLFAKKDLEKLQRERKNVYANR